MIINESVYAKIDSTLLCQHIINILSQKSIKMMIQKPQSSVSASKVLFDKNCQLRVLNNCLSTNIQCDLVSFLFGYTIAHFDLKLHQKMLLNLKKQFNSIKECLQIYEQLRMEDAILLVYDFIGDIKKIDSQRDVKNLERLPAMLNNNLSELLSNRGFIREKWQRQARLQEQAQLNQLYVKMILQEEQKERRNKAMQAESKGWECQVCLVQIDPQSMGILECGHIFHPECLNGYIKAQVQSNNINMNCPMEGCNRKMEPNDILSYIDGELRQKYEKFSFNKFIQGNFAKFSWCPTAGCSAVFQFDQALNSYRCPACQKHYCLKCRCLYHVGMTCAQYRINNTFDKNDEKFINFVKGAKFKQCPSCKYWVERNDGCSSMKCKCGQQFCYNCGGTGCPHGSCSNSGGQVGGGRGGGERRGFLGRLFG